MTRPSPIAGAWAIADGLGLDQPTDWAPRVTRKSRADWSGAARSQACTSYTTLSSPASCGGPRAAVLSAVRRRASRFQRWTMPRHGNRSGRDDGLDEPQHVVRPAGIDPVMALAAVLESRSDVDHGAGIAAARSRSASRVADASAVREDQPASRFRLDIRLRSAAGAATR